MSLVEALLIALIALLAFFFGVLGVAVDLLGRRVTSPTLRRRLLPGDLEPQRPRSLYASAFAVLMVIVGDLIAAALLVDGIRFSNEPQVAAAVVAIIAAVVVVVVIVRGTRPGCSRQPAATLGWRTREAPSS